MTQREAGPGLNRAARAVDRVLETLFLTLTGIYLIYTFSGMTTFFLPLPARFESVLEIILLAVALARLTLCGFRSPEIALGLAAAAVYALSWRTVDYSFLAFLAILTVGSVGIDYRKLLKTWLIAVGFTLLTAVLTALTGSIADVVYFRDGLRSSWGIAYPTDFSTAVLFLAVILWTYCRRLPDWALLPVAVVPVLLALFITRSRNSLICGALFIGIILYRMQEAQLEKRGRAGWLRRAVGGLLTVSFPLFAAITFLLVFAYSRDTSLGARLNELFSDRLRLSLAAFREHGLTPFGTAFDQIGNGFSIFPPTNYSFIDSSYVLILLRYGWATLLTMAVLWGWAVRKALRCGNRRLALAMGLIAFHSIMEHHFPEVFFNILLIAPMAAFPAERERQKRRSTRNRCIAAGVSAAVGLAAAIALLPQLRSRMRTVFVEKGWYTGGAAALPAIGVALVVVVTVAAALWALYKLVYAAAARRARGLYAIPVLLACAAVIYFGNDWMTREIDAATETAAVLVDVDTPALEALAGVPVYVDDFPEVYRRRFDNVRPTVLPCEELSRLKRASVVTDVATEHRVFFQSGFSFARISFAHGLYTNDPAAIAALEEAGIPVTGYFDVVRPVDMEWLASLNDLPLEARGLALDGPMQSLTHGPYVDLYEGQYEVKYRLALPEGAGEDGPVCTLRVNSYYGESTLASVPVTRDQFDEDGTLEVAVTFACGYSRGTEFLAFAEDGGQVYVAGIEYRMLPLYM